MDNSDWWSLTRTDDDVVPREGDLQDSNFQILGFKLNDETFDRAMMECCPAAFFIRQNEVQAADMLMSSVSPADRVAIVTYSKAPQLVLDFTADKSEVRDTVH